MRISVWSSDVCSSDLLRRYQVSRHLVLNEQMDGSVAVLQSSFSELVANGEYGIFAIGIDLTDPDFSLGSIVLLNGDDGWFRQSVPRLEIGRASCRARGCQYV